MLKFGARMPNYTIDNLKNMKERFMKLNRALIKKFELLPNVFEFSTEKYGIHEFAAIYGIEKILRKTKSEKLLKSEPNYYLERQHKRLVTYAANSQMAEYNKLMEIMLRKSVSLRTLAMNRVVNNWFTLPIRNLRRIWRELTFISQNLSSDLKFKRVWIDKKPGDYARPLGVPTPAWRCYSFNWMHLIETSFKASGRLATWQHGGRSGVGVLSCYKEIIPKILSSNTIYEFDIKGFFDNISHEQITKRIEEAMCRGKATEWIKNILKAKPVGYQLPPTGAEKAGDYSRSYWFRGEWEMIIPRFGKTYWYRIVKDIPEQTVNSANWRKAMERTAKLMPHIAKMNPMIINGITRWYYATEEAPLISRGRSKDSWNELSSEFKGVPQGLNTSPFISTMMTDVTLSELGTAGKLVMYMDDGILFAESKQEMEKLITRLKELLGLLKLELAEKKSKYVKIDGEWKDTLKFLGLRYLYKENTFMSDTRSGTKVLFPGNANWEEIKAMAILNGLSMPYMRRLKDRLINTQAYEAGVKYGFLGCLIAGSQYKDAPPMWVRKEQIRRGQASAWSKIENSKGFIWKSQDLMNHVESLKLSHDPQDTTSLMNLGNVSSVAVHKWLEFNRKGRVLFCKKKSYRGRKQRI